VLAALGAVPVALAGAGAAVNKSFAPGSAAPTSFVAPMVPGTRYFVSPDGDDDAPGNDVRMPWRTIDAVNRRMADGTIGAGDAVLFRSGATFPGKIRPAGIDLDAAPSGRLLLSAYDIDGSVARPVISSYKVLDVAEGWRSSAPDEWVIDLSADAYGQTHHGYSGAQGGADNIGFLRVDGVLHGMRRRSRAELAAPWDFFCEGTDLYVRSPVNPAGAASDLRAGCGETCVALTDGLEMRGLRVEGGGAHGAQGAARSITIADNEFGELGGSLLTPDTRYGNGVEIWIGSSDVEVSGNVLHDIYDVALTMQGDRSGDDTGWNGVAFAENLVYRCNQSIEFWSGGPSPGAQGFVRCTVARNVCLFAGRSWSSNVRPDQQTKVHLLTYGWTLPADISVVRNVFHDAVAGYRWSDAATPGLVASDNIIRLRPRTPLTNRHPDTIENGAAWAAFAATEPRSSFAVLEGDVTPDVGATLRQIRSSAPLDDRTRALLDTYSAPYR
jgi:hypothetical protein